MSRLRKERAPLAERRFARKGQDLEAFGRKTLEGGCVAAGASDAPTLVAKRARKPDRAIAEPEAK